MLSCPQNEAKGGDNQQTANLALTFKSIKKVVSVNLRVMKLKRVGMSIYTSRG
jgi:hypothetical protein